MSARVKRREGFTLVELAIVLVIVGLLIGGILAAQSMISTSKITAQVAQIQQFDAGVENFKTKYGYLPGDAPAFGGDGDGAIDNANVQQGNADAFVCEIANFWNNWDSTEYPGGSSCAWPGPQIVTTGPNKNVPLSKIGTDGSFIIASAMTSAGSGSAVDFTNLRNYYAIFSPMQLPAVPPDYQWITPNYSSYVTLPNPPVAVSVKATDLLALDSKIDDGDGNTGNVLAGSIEACCGNATVGAISSIPLSRCSDPSTGAYQVQNASYECTPLIRIGAQTGDPD
jgi:prepilin-type N-terminal cleavage/methylation domain-containing protein